MLKRKLTLQLMLALATMLTLAAFGSATAKEAKAEVKKAAPTVISVADAFADPLKYDGKVAIEGTVAMVDAKTRSFEILTPNPPGSCTSECCAPKRLPVKVPSASFKGDLPAKDKKVVVVGNFEALTQGFKFDPTEVKQGGKVILSKK